MPPQTILILSDDSEFEIAQRLLGDRLSRARDFDDFWTKSRSPSTFLSICSLANIKGQPFDWWPSLTDFDKGRFYFFGKGDEALTKECRAFPDIQNALEVVIERCQIESEASKKTDRQTDLKDALHARITAAKYGQAKDGKWNKARYNDHLDSISINLTDPLSSSDSASSSSPATSLQVASCVLAATLAKFLISNSTKTEPANATPHPMPIPDCEEAIELSWQKAFPLIFGFVDFLDENASVTMTSDSDHVSLCSDGNFSFDRELRGHSGNEEQIVDYRDTVERYLTNIAPTVPWSFATAAGGKTILSFKKAQASKER